MPLVGVLGSGAPAEAFLQQRLDEDILVVEEKHGVELAVGTGGGWSSGRMGEWAGRAVNWTQAEVGGAHCPGVMLAAGRAGGLRLLGARCCCG